MYAWILTTYCISFSKPCIATDSLNLIKFNGSECKINYFNKLAIEKEMLHKTIYPQTKRHH